MSTIDVKTIGKPLFHAEKKSLVIYFVKLNFFEYLFVYK